MTQQVEKRKHACPKTEPQSTKNQLIIDPEIDVEEGTSNNQYKSTLGGPKTEEDTKNVACVVDLGEGRDPGEEVGGEEIHSRVGKEGLRTERVSKPPEPRGLVRFRGMRRPLQGDGGRDYERKKRSAK